MTEMTAQKIRFDESLTARKSSKTTAVHLTFHLPAGMMENLSLSGGTETLKEVIKESLVEIKNVETQKIIECLRKIETIKAVENLDIAEVKYIEETPSQNGPIAEVAKEKLHINELIDDVYPFLYLKIKNQQMIYKVGTSFVHDIEKNLKHFAFADFGKSLDAKNILTYASFINYSLKVPVLVIVKDFNDRSLDKFRSQFTTGTLWKWKTHDWGNLCFVDYKELVKHAEDLNTTDLNFITHEFKAVLWGLPPENIQGELQRAALPILGKLDSVTFIISKGETKNKHVQKAASYYQCFSIPVKGILVGEGEEA